jgi:hypothetical protein
MIRFIVLCAATVRIPVLTIMKLVCNVWGFPKSAKFWRIDLGAELIMCLWAIGFCRIPQIDNVSR